MYKIVTRLRTVEITAEGSESIASRPNSFIEETHKAELFLEEMEKTGWNLVTFCNTDDRVTYIFHNPNAKRIE